MALNSSPRSGLFFGGEHLGHQRGDLAAQVLGVDLLDHVEVQPVEHGVVQAALELEMRLERPVDASPRGTLDRAHVGWRSHRDDVGAVALP